MRKQEEVVLGGQLVAMIDVVFQIIIFFVCTASMQDNARDAQIQLAVATHAKAETAKNPLQVEIEISKGGRLSVARTPLSESELYGVMRKAVNECSPRQVPVVIRADGRATHAMVRKAMDTCTAAGIVQVQIAAFKEKGGKQ